MPPTSQSRPDHPSSDTSFRTVRWPGSWATRVPRSATVLHHIAHVLGTVGIVAGPVLGGLGLAVALAVVIVRRRQHDRLARGARLVHVLAPPEVDPHGAVTVWTNLVALLRPAWRRVLAGQPHLGFELTASSGGLGIALWVPAIVPTGMVERAVEAAWPGARTETTEAFPPLPTDGARNRRRAAPRPARALSVAGRSRRRPAPTAARRPFRVGRRHRRLRADPGPTGDRQAHRPPEPCRGHEALGATPRAGWPG